jgi:hypothetical protein
LEWYIHKVGTSKVAKNQQKKPGRHKEEFIFRAFRGSLALLNPWLQISSLKNCESKNVCCFKLPVCGTLLPIPKEPIQSLPISCGLNYCSFIVSLQTLCMSNKFDFSYDNSSYFKSFEFSYIFWNCLVNFYPQKV